MIERIRSAEGLSLRAGGRGFPPATMSEAPRLLLMENRRKLEPKDESQKRCLIPRLLVVFTRQLEILTTTLQVASLYANLLEQKKAVT